MKEKIRGSSSGIEVPQLRQAKRSLKVRRSATPSGSSPAPFAPFTPPTFSPASRSFASPVLPAASTSTSTTPPARAAAASTDSESRRRRSPFITRRSTTTEMSWLYFLSSLISSSRRRSSPSTRTRLYPSSRNCSKSFSNSPFLPLTTGAITMNRVPSSRVITRSVICSIDCPSIGSPHSGQCGFPIRAQSRRR